VFPAASLVHMLIGRLITPEPSTFIRWCRVIASNKAHSLDAAMSFSLNRTSAAWGRCCGAFDGGITNPCCKVLKMCLEFGDDRAFHRAADGSGPLMVRTMSSPYQTRNGQERQFHEQAVIFCPFCGTHLQTPEDVERYMRGDPV